LPWDPADLEELLATAHETVTLARQIGNKERVLDAAAFRLHLLIAVGDLGGFSRDLEDFVQLADQLRQPFHQYHATVMRAAQALLVGRFAEAEQLARKAATQGMRLSGLDASGAFGMQMFTLAQERGELSQLAPLVEQFVQTTPSGATWRPALVLVLAELGQHEQAKAELERLAARQFHAVARDSLWLACLAYLAQACAIVRDLARADELYALLLPWKGRNLVAASMVVCYGPADRLLGMLSSVPRRWDIAARHFEAAIEMNRLQGSSPWLAHSQHEYAVMLLERSRQGDRQRACTLLASALQLAQNLGMTKLREAVSDLSLTLETRPRPPSYPGGLTRREAEVLRMIAAGKTNQEIAASIFRSPNTVANHVRSILAKLGAANRTEAAAFAVRHLL
jgi:DNA-binding CsgD family transcriptional regulator